MIKIPKEQLFRIVQLILLAFLYFFLPVYLTISAARNPLLLSLFYLINILIMFYLLRLKFNRRHHLEYKIQELEEKLNILNDENNQELESRAALKAKITRYSKLKEIIEELNQSLDLEKVTQNLTSIAFSVISDNKGACILYLIDQQLNLQIFQTRKEDEELAIKAKQGDDFDLWVLRHSSPLLVEDIKRDFRFDTSTSSQTTRPISSLVSAPLISEHRFFGTLRLDNPRANFFSQDDLRLLVKICDLGAAALENSELFQRVKNLAIHDSLTSLYTKEYFLERLKEECIRGVRPNYIFSLLILDIDFFKNYNDKFGHTAGDIVLKNLSRNIIGALKDLNPVRSKSPKATAIPSLRTSNGVNAIVSRFGGEEFCVLLPGIDKKSAQKIGEDLREGIQKEKIILRKSQTNITVSIGIATFPLDAVNEDELIQNADRAMYLAKLKGRNRVCCI